MIATSAEYKAAVDSHRQDWAVRATIDYTDYNLDNSITTVVDVSDRLSDDSQLADGIEVTTFDFFASWENFEWGQHFRSEESTRREKGALGERLSFGDKTYPILTGDVFGYAVFDDETVISDFHDYPSFKVTFSPRTINSLKVVFDSRLAEWAEEFDVNVYVDSAIDTTETVTGNSTFRWTKTLSAPILLAESVEVVVKKWNKTYSKAKIVESFTSVQEQYDSADIIDLAMYEESEPDDSTIPIGNVTSNTCSLTLINENNKFDNDNEASVLAGNITKNRRIKLYSTLAGQEIPLGTFYSQKWNIKSADLQAEVSGRDLIELMDGQEYDKNTFITPGSDQDFTYTTTADFNGFSLDNAEATDNTLIKDGSALYCDSTGTPMLSVGFSAFSSETPFSGYTYCGVAEKTQGYTYTPGTTVTVTLDKTIVTPLGTNVRFFLSYKTVDEWNEVNGDFVFTPEDVTGTSQNLKLRILLESQSTDVTPTVEDVTLTLSETITLYSIAAKVIAEFDDVTNLIEGNFTIDQEYGEIEIPNAYLDPQSYRSVLRMVSEGAAGRVFVDRLGALKLESIKSVSTSMKDYDNSNIFEKVQPVNPTSLYNRVTVVTKPLKQATSDEVIAEPRIELADGQTDTITIFWDEQPSEYSSFTLPASVTLDSYTDFTWGGVFTLTNSSGADINETAEINGKPYRVTGSRRVTLDDTESIRRNGVIEYVIDDNPLIQTVDQAEYITQLMIDSFSVQRRQTEIDALPDPSIEVGDSFTVDGNFYIVNKNEIEYSKGEIRHSIGGKS